jgi:hypothetical protein
MHIDQFCEDLRQKVAMTKTSLEALKTKIDTQAAEVEKDARIHLETVRERIERNRKKLAHSQKEAEAWVDHHMAEAKKKVAEWKAKGDAAKLRARADLAEQYAAATKELALAAVDEAEEAALSTRRGAPRDIERNPLRFHQVSRAHIFVRRLQARADLNRVMCPIVGHTR